MELIETKKYSFSIGDFLLLLVMLILIGIGLAAIYSATYNHETAAVSDNFRHQIYWFLIGCILFLLTLSFPVKFYQALSYLLYAAVLLSLIAVLLVGKAGGGAERWLSIAGIRFQPSEWAKMATILAMARFLSDYHDKLDQKQYLFIAAAIGGIPMILIFKQPDLGTSLVFLMIVPSMMYWGGIRPSTLILTAMPVLAMLASFKVWSFFLLMVFLIFILVVAGKPLLFSVFHIILNVIVGVLTPGLWNSLEPYQQKRVQAFLGIVNDPHGINYQVIQSKVAIGSGGFAGKGFLQGTQTHLRFLPEQNTDFIFSVIGEEFGFIGCAVVVLLFLVLLIRVLQIAGSVGDRFSSLVAIGLLTMFLYHFFVNIGMVVGILPVTGLPLPFISYGGSFLVTSMVSVALLLNISVRRGQI